jgi:hypothetical protein
MSRRRPRAFACALAFSLSAARLATGDERSERALQAEIDAARRQVMDLELALEREKRLIPTADMWEDDVANLMGRARAAGLNDVGPSPVSLVPIALDGGAPSPLELRRLTLSGRAPYEAVHRFVALLGGGPRRVDLEEVRLTAAPKGVVDFEFRLGLPVYIGAAATPPPASPRLDSRAVRTPEEARDAAREAVYRARLTDLRARLASLQALQRVLARFEERATRGRAFAALAQLHRATANLDVALTGLRLVERVAIEGVAVGAASRSGLAAALREAGFVVRDVPFSRQGWCHRFSVDAEVRPGEIVDVGAAENGPFDAATAAACAAADPRSRGKIAARGSDPNGITLRLRGVEVADLIRVLGAVTPLSFVVDADVDGRVDVAYDRASLDDAFDAMRAAGVVGQVGALVRVSNTSSGVEVGVGPGLPVSPDRRGPPKGKYSGEPVSVDIKEGDLRDMFRLFERISGLRFELPAGFEGRASLFVRDEPWDGVVDALADAAGLRYRVQGTRVVLERKGSARPVPAPERGRYPREPAKVGVEDLKPVGAALVEGSWQAYAYGPGRVLWTLVPGAPFFDGQVKAVTATAVTFEGAGKPVEVKLPSVDPRP